MIAEDGGLMDDIDQHETLGLFSSLAELGFMSFCS